jgi:hypothetical protein
MDSQTRVRTRMMSASSRLSEGLRLQFEGAGVGQYAVIKHGVKIEDTSVLSCRSSFLIVGSTVLLREVCAKSNDLQNHTAFESSTPILGLQQSIYH